MGLGRKTQLRRGALIERLENRRMLAVVPQLLRDINTATITSSIGPIVAIGIEAYFSANDGIHGAELWKSDGTEAGTVLVKDIRPGSSGSNPTNLTNLNGTLFFTANGPLWESDGTAAGTVQVVNNVVLGNNGTGSFAVLDGIMYFAATGSGTNTGAELWRSDGTAAGTFLVKDIQTGSGSSSPTNLTVVNDTLFFAATTTTNGTELWKSDGTSAGTILVKDILLGSSSSTPQNLTNVNGTLFFTANDGTDGTELWKSDGTSTGTSLVKNIASGSLSAFSPIASSTFLVNAGGILYFNANDFVNGQELWRSDGTSAGTYMVQNIHSGGSGSSPLDLTNFNGTLFFQANDGTHGAELWKSDGTAAGTIMVADIQPGGGSSSPSNLTVVGNTLYFQATTTAKGSELWATDGNTAGTVLVDDINPGSGSSSPSDLTNVNGTIFFTADNGATGTELWTSNGTAISTALVKDINLHTASTNFESITNKDGTLYFIIEVGTNQDNQLWKSDGTAGGTVMVKDLGSGGGIVNVSKLTIVDGILYYFVDLDNGHVQLWKSDGTTAGTLFLADIETGFINGTVPGPFTEFDGKLFFVESISDGTSQLWETDGAANGTNLVTTIDSGGTNTGVGTLVIVDDKIFFTVSDGATTSQLWESDGTAGGTRLLKDYPTTASDKYWIYSLTSVGNYLFFIVEAQDRGLAGTVEVQAWTTDGTPDGTAELHDFNTSGVGDTDPVGGNVFTLGDKLFFGLTTPVASDAGLWLYDPISNPLSIQLVISGSSVYPAHPVDADGTLFFSFDNRQLWKSDGTAAGTVLVYNSTWDIEDLTAVGNDVFFNMDEGPIERLWESDGTSAGTVRVSSTLARVGFLTAVGNDLFFQADDGVHGTELWALPQLTTAPGDFNADGHVDMGDLMPAMQALTNPAAYEAQYGLSAVGLSIIGDVNGDGHFNNADVQALLNLMITGGGSTSAENQSGTIARTDSQAANTSSRVITTISAPPSPDDSATSTSPAPAIVIADDVTASSAADSVTPPPADPTVATVVEQDLTSVTASDPPVTSVPDPVQLSSESAPTALPASDSAAATTSPGSESVVIANLPEAAHESLFVGVFATMGPHDSSGAEKSVSPSSSQNMTISWPQHLLATAVDQVLLTPELDHDRHLLPHGEKQVDVDTFADDSLAGLFAPWSQWQA